MTQRIIGLTGGMGTGKSTVAGFLAEYQIPVSDADYYARQALATGSPLVRLVVEHFGPQILAKPDHIDRKALGQRVFSDPVERHWLEAQIHPYVQAKMADDLEQWLHYPTVCLMIPLLFEAHLTHWVTEIWVVTCSQDLQCQRVQTRDGLSLSAIQERMASQWPLAEKVKQADVVIDNSGSLDLLRAAVVQALGAAPINLSPSPSS